MDEKTPKVEGGCLCGGVRFTVELPTMYCAHCHCSICRRAHGAAYVTWIGVEREKFRILAGADQLTRYRSSRHATRSFCRSCGSTLFFESRVHPKRVDIVLANIEGTIDRRPQTHVHFDDRVDWVDVDDGLPRLGGASGVDPL